MKFKLAIKILSTLIFLLVYPQESFGQAPIIILGGEWAGNSDNGASSIPRICNTGFTHIHSYATEGDIKKYNTPENAIAIVKKFTDTVKLYCPKLKPIIGIPRNWITHKLYHEIIEYISGISELNIDYEYFYSDEPMYQMMKSGDTIEEATQKISRVADTIQSHSGKKYIVIEPGNYGPEFNLILNSLSSIKKIQPGFNEYIISKNGPLRKNKILIQRLNETVKKFSPPPVVAIEIGQPRINLKPTPDEILYQILNLMTNSSGFIFYEERWASDATLLYLKNSLEIYKILKISPELIVTKINLFDWLYKSKNLTVKTTLENEDGPLIQYVND